MVYALTGNTLGDTKEIMVRNRLEKINRHFGHFNSVSELLENVKNGTIKEAFINAFTTNKTEFFREYFHFEDLISRVFEEHFKTRETIDIYSCASSSGEEIYSIAISFQHYKALSKKLHLNMKITASDIDTAMLKKAEEGIYKHPKHGAIFPEWVIPSKYFKKREVQGHDYFLIKAKDSIRKNIAFKQLNLIKQRFPFENNSLDVIFCRNVLIYFNQEDQNKILKKLLALLKVGGTLYLGHSESPLEITPALHRLGMNIFIKKCEL